MVPFLAVSVVLSLVILGVAGETSCTFSRSTKKVKCGKQECLANTDNTPTGYYKLGAVEFNSGKGKNWVNLYPKKHNTPGYWDYYCENPDTGRTKIALHPGSISLGCISVPDNKCWAQLEAHLRQQSPYSFSVTGVQRSGYRSFATFSCKGSRAAGEQITKTVSVIGLLHVTN